MQVNNLGGVRVPVNTTTDSTSQTARAGFSTRLQGGTGTASAGRPAIPGSSIVSSAISMNSGTLPGSAFGVTYLQARPPTTTGTGSTTAPSTGTTGQSPATNTTSGTAGSEFNAELQSTLEQQQQMKELMQLSLQSFVASTFSAGQNRGKIEPLDD
ncbi:hypothetical protein [Hyalangium versicolor]|uniref:hypothetical protein n=1 Tax=Hyalangium versicolor TaxID=2861190 RepID=UPI001CCC4017|nr:hypothetical protein [Hyalangium versicolor]